jgi:biotin transport system substrate-specific component
MSSSAVSVVVVDSWASRSAVRNAVLVLGFVAFIAASAQVAIPLPFTPIPMTLQTFAILAGAGALGANRAVAGTLTYLVAAAAGAPILAGEFAARGEALSAGRIFGASGGYLVGFVVAAYLVGRISGAGASKRVSSTFAAFIVGTAVIYAFGVSWLAVSMGQSFGWALENGMLPFIAGDFLKALAAGLVLPSLWKLTK